MRSPWKDTNHTLHLLREITHQIHPERASHIASDLIVRAPEPIATDLLLDYCVHHDLFCNQTATHLRDLHEATLQRTYWIHPTSQLPMVWIPAHYVHHQTPHQMSLPGFALSVHPVTNELWARFHTQSPHTPTPPTDHNPAYLQHWAKSSCASPREQLHLFPPTKPLLFAPKLAQIPVTYISFDDALAYCAWANLTLPTLVMWEKAALGFPKRQYPWGEHNPKQGWVHGDYTKPRPVESAPHIRTAYGCQDMFGNVAELCFWVHLNTSPSATQRFDGSGSFSSLTALGEPTLTDFVQTIHANSLQTVQDVHIAIQQLLPPRVQTTDLPHIPRNAFSCGGCDPVLNNQVGLFGSGTRQSVYPAERGPWLSIRPAWVPERSQRRPYPNHHSTSHEPDRYILDDDDIPF